METTRTMNPNEIIYDKTITKRVSQTYLNTSSFGTASGFFMTLTGGTWDIFCDIGMQHQTTSASYGYAAAIGMAAGSTSAIVGATDPFRNSGQLLWRTANPADMDASGDFVMFNSTGQSSTAGKGTLNVPILTASVTVNYPTLRFYSIGGSTGSYHLIGGSITAKRRAGTWRSSY